MKVQSETAAAILALRDLLIAACQQRADGAEVLAKAAQGNLRIVLDESAGLITFGIPGPANAVVWLESILCDPRDERRFGALASDVLDGARTH